VADLIAQGTDAAQRWRRPLPTGETIVLGRASAWAAPWDDRISRVHVQLVWDGQMLAVCKIPTARNAVFFGGNETTEFRVAPGEHFVIGNTTFTVAAERAFVTVAVQQPAQQQAFTAQYLRRMRFRHADQRIEILSRLPEVMSAAAGEFDQHVRVINSLLAGVPRADAAALVCVHDDAQPIEVRNWDRRLVTGDDFEPSERLIRETVRRGESIVHVWNNASLSGTEFTARQGVDWAYCTPIPGKSSEGWAVYISGRFAADPASELSDPTDLPR
jgi:adenylate cyclase